MRTAACAIPRDYRGAVVRLNAELVQGLIGQPQALRAVVDGQDGALVVRDETGLAAMLGLKKGDRVTLANGIALRAPEDVIVSILRPLAANQAVRVQGTRGTEARELLILNAGACPV
jgi:S1-C subfamily serine protease